jgi:hypothetical protein
MKFWIKIVWVTVITVLFVCAFSLRAADLKLASTNASQSTGSWVTVINVASGAGWLHHVTCGTYGDATYERSGHNCNIRITVDGGSAQTANDVSLGMAGSTPNSFSLDGGGERLRFIRWKTKARYESSLLVEVMQDSGGSQNLTGIAVYSEE